MRAIQRRHPDAREAAVRLLVDGRDGIRHPFSVGRNLRIARLFEGEEIPGGNATALRRSGSRGSRGQDNHKKNASHKAHDSPTQPAQIAAPWNPPPFWTYFWYAGSRCNRVSRD